MIESLTRAEYDALRRRGMIQRLIVNLPPRHLKSLMPSIAFPDWVLGAFFRIR
jgi:hypothetical protein